MIDDTDDIPKMDTMATACPSVRPRSWKMGAMCRFVAPCTNGVQTRNTVISQNARVPRASRSVHDSSSTRRTPDSRAPVASRRSVAPSGSSPWPSGWLRISTKAGAMMARHANPDSAT